MTTTDEAIDQPPENIIEEGEIISVLNVSDYYTCVVCGGKVNRVNAFVGECLKCNGKVKLSRCKQCTTVKIVAQDSHGSNFTLTAYNDNLLKITTEEDTGSTMEDKLLLAPRQGNVITNVQIV